MPGILRLPASFGTLNFARIKPSGRAVVEHRWPLTHARRLGDIDNVNEPSRRSERPAVLHDGPPRRLDPGEIERTIGGWQAQYSGHFSGGLEPILSRFRSWTSTRRGAILEGTSQRRVRAWPESLRLPSSTAPAEGIFRMPSVWRKKSSRRRSRTLHRSGWFHPPAECSRSRPGAG